MSKNRLILYGIIFGIAFLFIILGLILNKKEEKNPAPEVRNGVTLPASKDNPLDGDNLGEMPDRGVIITDMDDIYAVEKKKKEEETALQHKGLAYGLKIPAEDMKKMTIEETDNVGIVSTAFYYEAEGTRAYVFSINNYNRPTWNDMRAGLNEPILGETPIRVITYSVASDNPFEEGTKASDTFLDLVERVPAFVEDFAFDEEEEEETAK